MRILMLTNDSIIYPNGGMGVLSKHIAENLAKLGHSVDIIGLPTKQDDIYDLKFGNYTWNPIFQTEARYIGEHQVIGTLINQCGYVARAINLPKPDIIHALDAGTAIAAENLAKIYGVQWIFSIQLSVNEMFKDMGLNLLTTEYGVLLDSIEQIAVQNCSALVSVSNDYDQRFFKFKGGKFVINNGINLDEFEQFNKISLPGSNRLKVLYIGRYDLMKNVLSVVNSKIPNNIDILFAGGRGAGLDHVYDYVVNTCNNSDQLHFIGYKSNKEKVDLMNSVDAVIFPSIHEPFGIVGLEALASKKVLLASNVTGMKDYLRDGCYINCGTTPERISKALFELSNMTEIERQIMGNDGYNSIQRFDWKYISRQYEQLYYLYTKKIKLWHYK